MIPNGKPFIESQDIAEVTPVLESGWLSTGPKVDEFEKEFSQYVGCKYAVAVNSGTAALELALACLNLREGEVITTPLTFVATSNAILYNNLKPVFVDIKPDTLNIDPVKVKEAITDKTKAILCVDYAGQPCELDELRKIADEHNLFLIEDAAQSVGARYKGRKIGTISDLSTFSFHPLKNMTTGEGGMITTDNEEFYKKMLMLRNHGLDKNDKSFGGDWSYNLKHLGRNFRLTDFQCALGMSQLKKLDKVNQRRAEIVEMYKESFKDIPEITFPKVKDDVTHPWHLSVVLLNDVDRNVLFNKLKEKGVGGNIHYIPIYKFDYYKKLGYNLNLPVTEDAFSRMLTLPLFSGMSNEEVNYVIKSVKESIQELRRDKMKKIVVIIPARGGSKGIPGKNIKLFNGKPLISYVITAALEAASRSGRIDKVIVSTDCENIAKVAKEYGAEVPFLRPKELAGDEVATLPVLQHTVDYLEKEKSYSPDIVMLSYATSPLLKAETFLKVIEKIDKENCEHVMTVSRDLKHYWVKTKENNLKRFYPTGKPVNRQWQVPLFKETAAIYVTTRDMMMEKDTFFGDNEVAYVEMEEYENVDVDTPFDFEVAQFIHKLEMEKKKEEQNEL